MPCLWQWSPNRKLRNVIINAYYLISVCKPYHISCESNNCPELCLNVKLILAKMEILWKINTLIKQIFFRNLEWNVFSSLSIEFKLKLQISTRIIITNFVMTIKRYLFLLISVSFLQTMNWILKRNFKSLRWDIVSLMGIHKYATWFYWIPTCPITTKLVPCVEQKAHISTRQEQYNPVDQVCFFRRARWHFFVR